MKKYLMTGIAALALCVGFTSCSHDLETLSQEEIDQLKAQQIVEKYNKAFIATFGEPAKNQNWGFGSSAGLRTRINTTSSSANTNHNEWAAVDNVYKLLVPPAITKDQALRVKAYFQSHQYLTYNDPLLTKFFVQQVYKGNPETKGNISDEEYRQQNGKTVTGSDHMDKLTVGNDEQHVNDFNNGTGGPADVLNNGTIQNNYVPNGTTHEDMITLMTAATTECVGFWVSDGSVQHNDCCALVSAKDIDDWANLEENKVDGVAIGEDVYYGYDINGVENSFWERSFVGLDYEQISLENLYKKENGEKVYAKALDFITSTPDYIFTGGELVRYADFENDFLYNPNGKKVPYIDCNPNEALGETVGGGKNSYCDTWGKDKLNQYLSADNQETQDRKVLDLDMIQRYVDQFGLPNTRNEYKFVLNAGGRDYVFSDWIVTLSPAKSFTYNPPLPPNPFSADLRIMAEDLSADEKTDFDFNDVVFDVQYTKAATSTNGGNPARIRVKAAGGTLPLRIKVKSTADLGDDECTGKNGNGWQEVHALWGKSTGIMINTNATTIVPGKGYEARNGEDDDTIIDLDWTVTTPEDADGIIIQVNKGGQWNTMRAEKGEPAAKFATNDTDKRWADERENLKDNSNFSDWVQGALDDWDWYEPKTNE